MRNKKTACPSTLTVRVYHKFTSAVASHPNHACLIELKYCHNHPVNSAHALSFRPVDSTVKEEYINLFEFGNSAATARHEYTNRLQMQHDTPEVEVILADRSVNPNCQVVQRLFQKWREKCVGPENGKLMFDRLSKKINEFNDTYASEGGRAFLQRYQSEEIQDQAVPPEPEPVPKVKKVQDHAHTIYPGQLLSHH